MAGDSIGTSMRIGGGGDMDPIATDLTFLSSGGSLNLRGKGNYQIIKLSTCQFFELSIYRTIAQSNQESKKLRARGVRRKWGKGGFHGYVHTFL